jgi:hypothetical protein
VIDPEKRDDAIRLAAYAYRRYGPHRRSDGPDTLLDLADLLDRVWELLCPTANVNRLMEVIVEDGGDPAPVPVVHDFMTWVDRYACLARLTGGAVSRRKPRSGARLPGACRLLAGAGRHLEFHQRMA